MVKQPMPSAVKPTSNHRSDMSYFRFLAVNNAPAVQFDVR